jgi:hypothetical protein
LKKARGYQKDDNNKNTALTGRLGLSPFLGLELGLSAYRGQYDIAGALSTEIQALDFAAQKGSTEIQGEAATSWVETSNSLTYVNKTGRMEGYYLQLNQHFLHDKLKPGSVFTAVLRWDDINLSGRLGVGSKDSQRLSLGLNFRPVEDVVFKAEWQGNYEDRMKENAKGVGKTNDAVNLGFASYF